MADISRGAKVGLMSVVLIGAAYGGYRFVARDAGTGNGYTVWALIPDITGVPPKSRVTVSGIQVGIVDEIKLDEETGKAKVFVRMKPDVPLFEDASIGKKAASLIGESLIVLAPGTKGKAQIPDGGQVRFYMDEPTVESLQGQIAEILKDVKAVTGALKNTVGNDKGQERIDQILANLTEITQQLSETVKENREAVKGTINNVNAITDRSRPEIASILTNIRTVTEDIRKMTTAGEAPGAGGKPGEVKTAVDRVNRAAASLEKTLQHADNIAAKIDKGEGTMGRLIKDEALINEVESVVEDVGQLVGGLGRMQTIVGLRTDYNFLANTIKSYVEVRLQPSEDKYYSIEIVNDPRGRVSFEQIDVDTTNPNDPPHYREIRTITTNAFRFSFQFAKRLGPLTGRFGIKESTGGIGLDVSLLDDRFELRQDLFGFGEALVPRWRIALSYEFIRKLWLLGGIDDLLNGDRRDYFVGLQLRFNDQDLKTVLPFAPSGAF
jgi:phospholipid/cholesterol/gamma-HCH transport system substrate-binding protein